MSENTHYFGENKEEMGLPVWQSPKYKTAREFAVNVIDSGKYNLEDSDFWILMNKTKSGKMAYTGLILSHNGCLKINDVLSKEQRFRPECVSLDKDGYGASLVYTYNCPDQGIYEVGEFSAANGKNAYPYAMAFKRMFDRVVLKISKLAYSGIYSDSEADEFAEHIEEGEKARYKDEKQKDEPKSEPKPKKAEPNVQIPFIPPEEPKITEDIKKALAVKPRYPDYTDMTLGEIYKKDRKYFDEVLSRSTSPDVAWSCATINAFMDKWEDWSKAQKK